MTTVHCQNCTWSGAENQTEFLHDVFERVPPGTIMPWGECPECGCACYPRDEPAPPPDAPMTPVCGTCGSSDMAILSIDVQWDHDHQLWTSSKCDGDIWCNACDDTTTLAYRPTAATNPPSTPAGHT